MPSLSDTKIFSAVFGKINWRCENAVVEAVDLLSLAGHGKMAPDTDNGLSVRDLTRLSSAHLGIG